MANFRGLSAFLVLCAAALASDARASVYGGQFTTQAAAYAGCQDHEWPCSGPYPASSGGWGVPFYQAVDPNNQNAYHVWLYGSTVCPNQADPPNADGTCGVQPDSPEECLARNVPDPGDTDGRGAADMSFPVGTAPTSRCIDGCQLNTWAIPHRTFQGVNPFTGATMEYGTHHQEWAATTCTGEPPPPVPGQMEFPPSTPNPEWSCNAQAATCTSPDGDVHVCTFTSTPTSDADAATKRSSCVPIAGDSDGDGIPNDRDSAPNDATNGEDTGPGDESDNTSSGGGDCNSPPQSSGDAIAVQVAYQTWATRCAVEKFRQQEYNVSGTALTTTQAADLAATKANTAATTAAITALGGKIDSASNNAAATAAQAQATKDAIEALNDELTEPGNLPDMDFDPTANGQSTGLVRDVEVGADLDTAGVTGPSVACPAPPDVTIGGQVIHIDTTKFCEWIQLGAILVVLSATILSVRILGS